mgnify:FL=1
MERLTFDGNFCDIAQCRKWPCQYDGSCTQKQVWEKLKAYEDTGLTPEELKAALTKPLFLRVAAQALGVDIVRLSELAEADKDGRAVVLPCKIGDTVWRMKRTFETFPDKSKPYIEPDAFLLQDVFNIGKTVFLTHEEAEKALQEME